MRLFDLSTGKNVRDMYLADNSDATKYGEAITRCADKFAAAKSKITASGLDAVPLGITGVLSYF